MSQIFHKGANALAFASIVAVVILGGIAMGILLTLPRSDYITRKNLARTQPIQFSHAHHVGGMGFDCRYCHTSVEDSHFAGIPPTKTCMNCHSQLFVDSPYLEPVRASFRNNTPLTWVRVNDLADFVYFNHSIHVTKGVGCATCHGPVDRMPLMYKAETLQMDWCLACHRQPERFLRPRDQVFNMKYEPPSDQLELGRRLVKEYHVASVEQLTSCSTCHR
jgi:hypothetical protein